MVVPAQLAEYTCYSQLLLCLAVPFLLIQCGQSTRGGKLTSFSLFSFLVGADTLLRRAARRGREAFRPGTQTNVRSHILLYTAFARHFNFTDFPADCEVLLAFAEFLLQAALAPKSVLNALSSMKHFHLDTELSVVAFGSRQLWLWRRALPLTCRHMPVQAPPI